MESIEIPELHIFRSADRTSREELKFSTHWRSIQSAHHATNIRQPLALTPARTLPVKQLNKENSRTRKFLIAHVEPDRSIFREMTKFTQVHEQARSLVPIGLAVRRHEKSTAICNKSKRAVRSPNKRNRRTKEPRQWSSYLVRSRPRGKFFEMNANRHARPNIYRLSALPDRSAPTRWIVRRHKQEQSSKTFIGKAGSPVIKNNRNNINNNSDAQTSTSQTWKTRSNMFKHG